jgi:mycothiol system anti-sigma-R factor
MPDDEPCEGALRELYSFLDGALTDDRRAAIQQHLDDCPPCYEHYDFEAELRLIIAAKCKDTVSDMLRDRIAQALVNEAPPSDSTI